MKNIDTIFRSTPTSQPPSQKKKVLPDKYWPLFYKSLQIALTVWIVTVAAIITQPWLDLWFKSLIFKTDNSQVMGQSTVEPATQAVSETDQKVEFHFKNAKVEINAPIVEGIDKDALKTGIGHHTDSVWPNQKGNVVLAGHNYDLDAENPYREVFISLRLVDVGDEVTIDYQGKTYHYQVFKKETASSSDNSLFSFSDEWLLTFYTCDPPYTDWKRLVLQAKLERIE